MKASFIFIITFSAVLLGSCRPQRPTSQSKAKSAQASVDRIKTQKKAPVAKSLYYVPVKGQPPVMVKAPAGAGYGAKEIPLTQLKPEDYGKVFCPKGTASVVIPEGVVRIPKFMCGYDLTSHLPDSYVFIEKVSLPSTLKSIGVFAFSGNRIKELSLPEGLERIGESAFGENELEHVALPQSLQFIGEEAFRDNKLSSLTLPSRHELIIGDYAFSWNKLKSLVLPKNVKLVGSEIFGYNELTKLTVEEGVTTIPPLAFENNQLKSVTLPSTIEGLGAGAFSGNPHFGFLADLTILSRRAPKILPKTAGSEPLPDNFFGLAVTSKPKSHTYSSCPSCHVKIHVPAGATGYSGPEWQGYLYNNLLLEVVYDAKE